jgi:hypothetical protein
MEIMESQKCGIAKVGKSQSVLVMIDPIISTRTRTSRVSARTFTMGVPVYLAVNEMSETSIPSACAVPTHGAHVHDMI